MSIRSSDLSRNQTRWKFGETYFYANIPEEIQDLKNSLAKWAEWADGRLRA